MRFALLLFMCSFCANCVGEQLLMSRPRTIKEVDRSKFYAHKDRIKQRREKGLEARRIYNSSKVHKYWTATVYPVNYNRYYYNTGRYPVYRNRTDVLLYISDYRYGE